MKQKLSNALVKGWSALSLIAYTVILHNTSEMYGKTQN